MDAAFGHLVVQLGGDGAGLGDLLGHEALSLQHVQEVGVAAEVELVGALQSDPALHEQAGEDSVQDGGTHLGLDVVAHDGQVPLLKAALPVLLAGDEHGDAVDHGAAGLEHLLHVPLGGLLAPHRQVVDDHMRVRVAEYLDDVRCGARRFADHRGQILADAIVGHAAGHGHAQMGHICELVGVVGRREDSLREVLADLVGVDVEGGHELDVADVVAAQVGVHQSRYAGVAVHSSVEVHPLH